MDTEKAQIVFRLLSRAIETGGALGRKTDVPGIACQMGSFYKVTREECEELLGKTLVELIEITGGTYGTRAKCRRSKQ